MTADLSFQIMKKDNVIRIPKAALRFYPPDKKYVHPDDHAILDGSQFAKEGEETAEDETKTSNTERLKSGGNSKKRHVWKLDGELLRAVEVQVGLSDNHYTELVSGDLDENTVLVTGQKAKDEK
jgi:HlyD family secretion protein